MAITLDQKIAQAEAELARLKQQSRALETGQKIILGGLFLNAAKADRKMREMVIKMVREGVTRPVDRKRIRPVLDDLEKITNDEMF